MSLPTVKQRRAARFISRTLGIPRPTDETSSAYWAFINQNLNAANAAKRTNPSPRQRTVYLPVGRGPDGYVPVTTGPEPDGFPVPPGHSPGDWGLNGGWGDDNYYGPVPDSEWAPNM